MRISLSREPDILPSEINCSSHDMMEIIITYLYDRQAPLAQ